jgi:hypothetical protein
MNGYGKQAEGSAQSFKKNAWMLVTLVLLCARGPRCWSQAEPTGSAGARLSASLTFGGQRTQVENFGYKALGIGGDIVLQTHPLFGLEARAASYGIHARYAQEPITAGIHLESYRRDVYRPHVYGFIGGGISDAQDAGPHYVALPAAWSPCWQASEGIVLPVGRVQWKLYEATWTETFTAQRSLGGLSVATGIVYKIGY